MQDGGATIFDDEDSDYLSKQVLTYIGNKRQLLPMIIDYVLEVRRALNKDKMITLDLFSGSGIVARALKQYSNTIYANDLELYSKVINECYLTNTNKLLEDDLTELLNQLNHEIKINWNSNGFITQLYAPKDDENIKAGERAFYSRRNAEYLDTARQQIAKLPLDVQKFFLAPLLTQASIHANTAGVFKGFYKDANGIGCFGGVGKNALTRILGDIRVEKPIFSRFNCDSYVTQKDASRVVSELHLVDLAYLDPPYNQHPYGSNYFMLNILASYKRPQEISEVSGIPNAWNRSLFNQPRKAQDELFEVIRNCRAKYMLISYNSEGFISYEDFAYFLNGIGEVKITGVRYNTFRGSRNLHDRDIHVKEYLFLVKKKLY